MAATFRTIGLAVVGMLVLVALAVGAVYAISESKLNAHLGAPTDRVPVPTDSASIQHGQHVAGAIALCTQCHGANLAGMVVLDNAVARVVAPNLTGGGAGASDADDIRAIRHGVDASGRPLWIMPSDAYNAMSDTDVGSVIAYLRSLPPISSNLPSSQIRPIGRLLLATGQLSLLPASRIGQSPPPPPAPTPDITPAYGQYLATIAACSRCHGPGLSGGPTPGSAVVATNITPSGIGAWSEADFTRLMRTGHRPDGSQLDPTMPWMYYAQMSDLELRAIWEYLGVVPARTTGSR
jgi:mono/diheme cytochrome c family protein